LGFVPPTGGPGGRQKTAAHGGPGGDPARPFDPGCQREQIGGPLANTHTARRRWGPARGPRTPHAVKPRNCRPHWFTALGAAPSRFAWFAPGTPQQGASRSIPLADNGLRAAPVSSACPGRRLSERPAVPKHGPGITSVDTGPPVPDARLRALALPGLLHPAPTRGSLPPRRHGVSAWPASGCVPPPPLLHGPGML